MTIVELLESRTLLSATPISLGSVISVNSNLADASLTYQFTATAGPRGYLSVSSITTNNSAQPTGHVNWNLIDPSGQKQDLASNWEVHFPLTGTYSLIAFDTVDPASTTLSFSFSLIPVLDGTTPITLDSTVSGSIAIPTQTQSYTFSLNTPSQLFFDSQTNDRNLTWTLKDSLGRSYTPSSPNGYGERSFRDDDAAIAMFSDGDNFATIPRGTYTLTVSASQRELNYTGAYKFKLSNLANATAITPGTPVSGTLDPSNSAQLFQFTAVAGQPYYFKSLNYTTTNTTLPSDGPKTYWDVYDPSGQLMLNPFVTSEFSYDLGRATFAKTGVYTVKLGGNVVENGTVTYAFNVLPVADTTLPLTLNSTVSSRISQAGQINNYTFTLPAPTPVWFDSLTDDTKFAWSIAGPNGAIALTNIGTTWAPFANDDKNLGVLPAGQYTVSVSATASVYHALTEQDTTGPYAFRLLSSLAATPLTLGATRSSTLNPANSMQLYQFSGTAGEELYFGNTGFSTQDTSPAAGSATWTLLDPFNRQVFSTALQTDGGRIQLGSTGTYTLVVAGAVADTATTNYSFNVHQTNDVSGPLTLNTPVSRSLTTIGQHDTYSFTLATPTQLWFDSQTSNLNLTWQISWANGVVSTAASGQNPTPFGSDDQQLRFLPPGTYTLTVAGTGTAIGSYAFNLLNLANGSPITAGTSSLPTGTTMIGSLSPANESNLYSFTGLAGDQLAFHNVSMTAGSTSSWQLLDPYGKSIFIKGLGSDQTVTLPYSGRYVLITKNLVAATATTAYQFQVNYQGHTTPTSSPNTPLTLGNTYTNATNPLGSSGEVDFEFTLAAPTQIWIDARSSDGNATWQLTGPSGVVATPPGFFQYGTFQVGSGTLGYLGPGIYTLKITARPNVYLTLDSYSVVLRDAASAPAITPGVAVYAAPPDKTSNLFAVSGTATQVIYLQSLVANSQLFYLGWNLYDSNGSKVANGNFARDSGRITLPVTGTYTLAVFRTPGLSYFGSYGFTIWSPIDTSSSLSLNAPMSGTIGTPGQIQNWNFTLTAQKRLWLDALNADGESWQITGPSGVVAGNQNHSTASPIVLPAGGYTLTFSRTPDATGPTGSYAFGLFDFDNFTSMNTGSSISGTLNQTQTSKYYQFSGTAGQSLYFQSQNYTTTNTLGTSTDDDNYSLYDTNGTLLFNRLLRRDYGAVTLASTGTYYVVVQRAIRENGSTTFALKILEEHNTTVPLTFNTEISGTISIPQQRNSYTFTLSQWTKLHFDALKSDVHGDNGMLGWTLMGPEGIANYVIDGLSIAIFSDQDVILAAGTYTLTITTTYETLGSYSFSLLNSSLISPIPRDTMITATVSERSTQVYSIAGTAGESIYISSDGFSTTDQTGTNGKAYWGIDYAGTLLTSDFGRFTFPTTAAYELIVQGMDYNSGENTYSLIVHSTADTTVPLTLGSTVDSAISRMGQSKSYTLTLNAPTLLYLDSFTNSNRFTWSLTGDSLSPYDSIYDKPFSAGDQSLDLLPAGTYTLTVKGNARSTGGYSFRLIDKAAAPTVTAGIPVSVSASAANSAQVYQLSGTAGQTLYFAQTGFSTSDSSGQNGKAIWSLTDQYGTVLFNAPFVTDGGRITLPQTGSYRLMIVGDIANNGLSNYSFKVTQVADQTLTMSLNSQVTGNVSSPGNQLRYTFSLATAAQLWFDSQTVDNGLTWQLTGPGGVVLTPAFGQSPTPFGSDDQSLGLLSAGAYTLTVTGSGQHTGAFAFNLLNVTTATPFSGGSVGSPNGAIVTGSLSVPTGVKLFSFTGTAGDQVAFHILSPTAGTTASWQLLDPNGGTVFNAPFTADQSGVMLGFSGTYTLAVRGAINASAATNFSFQLNYLGHPAPVSFTGVALSLGANYNESFAPIGNTGKGNYQFTLATPMSLFFSSHSTSNLVSWQLTGPQGIVPTVADGSLPTKFSEGNQSLGLLPAGSYSLTIFGPAGSPYSFALFDFASAVAITPGVPVTISQSGAIAERLYQFTGTAGEIVNIPLYTMWYLSLYDQFGRVVSENSNSVVPAGMRQFTLPSTGRYTIVGNNQDTLLTLWPSPNQTVAITADKRVTGNITTPGEVDSYTFSVTSPQELWLDPHAFDTNFNWSLMKDGVFVKGFVYLQKVYLGTLLPGSYSLNIGSNNGFAGSYAFKLLPLPVTPNITVIDNGGAYTGAASPATATFTDFAGATPRGNIVFTYYQGRGTNGVGSTTAPVDVGIYTVVATFTSADLNVGNAMTSPVMFTIAKASPTIVGTAAGGTFNGKPFPATATATGINGATIAGTTQFTYYKGNAVSGAGSTTAPTNAGTYTVAASFTSGNPNYGNASSVPVTFTIAKAIPTVTTTAAGGTFKGSSFPASAKVTGISGTTIPGTTTFTYYIGTTVSVTGSPNAPINSGTYTVVAMFTSTDANYANVTSAPVTFTIAKAIPTVVASHVGGVFSGTSFPATARTTGVGGSAINGNVAFTYYPGSGVSVTGSSTAPTNTGTYTVVATFASSNTNYTNATSSPVTFTIAKATLTVVATDAGGIFKGSAFPATAQVTGIGGAAVTGSTAFTYYVGNAVNGAGSSTAPTNTGTYTVVAAFTSSNANYANATSSPVTFTIAKATPTVVATDAGGIFTGSAFPATAQVTGIGGAAVTGSTAFTYYVGNAVNGAGSSTPPTNAGTYTVVAMFTSSNANYGNAVSSPVTFTITPSASPIAPVVTLNPTSQGVIVGRTIAFTAAASGSPTPTVQWQISYDRGATFVNISGATSTQLNFTTTASQNGAQFRAIFKNVSGTSTTTAATLTLTTAVAPTITLNPTNQSVIAGAAVTFIAAASGTPVPTVQWQISTDGGTHFVNISGATSPKLNFFAKATQNGAKLRAVFTNDKGTAITLAAALTVL